MSRFKLVNIIDSIFISFTLFLIVFSIIQFIVGDFALTLIFSILVTLSIIFVTRYLKGKKKLKTDLNTKTKLEIENYYLNFSLYSLQKQLKTILEFIPKEKSAEIKNNHIEYQNTVVIILNSLEEISKDELIYEIKNFLHRKLNIICLGYAFKKEAIELGKSINENITFLDKYDFYKLCINNNIKIENKIKIKQEKIKIKDIALNFFNKKHAKGFFFSGFILIFTSFIIPFRNYYLFFGIILLIFSLICRLKKSEQIKDFNF